jgi:hypothetical protein
MRRQTMVSKNKMVPFEYSISNLVCEAQAAQVISHSQSRVCTNESFSKKHKDFQKQKEEEEEEEEREIKKVQSCHRGMLLHLYIRHCKSFTLRLMPIGVSRNISPAIGLFVCMCPCGLFVRDLAQSLLAEQATGCPFPLVRPFGYVTCTSCISAIKSPASNNYS